MASWLVDGRYKTLEMLVLLFIAVLWQVLGMEWWMSSFHMGVSLPPAICAKRSTFSDFGGSYSVERRPIADKAESRALLVDSEKP